MRTNQIQKQQLDFQTWFFQKEPVEDLVKRKGEKPYRVEQMKPLKVSLSQDKMESYHETK